MSQKINSTKEAICVLEQTLAALRTIDTNNTLQEKYDAAIRDYANLSKTLDFETRNFSEACRLLLEIMDYHLDNSHDDVNDIRARIVALTHNYESTADWRLYAVEHGVNTYGLYK